nr:ABC transporter permease [Bacillus sp. FJAT-47783]
MKRLKNIESNMKRNNLFQQWLQLVLPWLAILILLIAWEVGVRWSGIEKWILPAPSEVIKSFASMQNTLYGHIWQTLIEAVLGLCIALVVGVLTAIVVDTSIYIRRMIYPLLVISQTIPIIALAPLFIIWFGFGILPKVMVVSLVCFFPIAMNLSEGLKLVDRDMQKLMQSLGATRWQVFKKLKLPSAMPFFFSGLKIAGTYSVMGAVIGEWLGASKGLGILLTRSSQSFLTERVFATIIVIVLLSLAIFFLIELIGRMTMAWHFKQQQSISRGE